MEVAVSVGDEDFEILFDEGVGFFGEAGLEFLAGFDQIRLAAVGDFRGGLADQFVEAGETFGGTAFRSVFRLERDEEGVFVALLDPGGLLGRGQSGEGQEENRTRSGTAPSRSRLCDKLQRQTGH